MHFRESDLEAWRESERVNVTSSRDPLVRTLLDACQNRSEVNITYFGGTNPGGGRVICPIRVFRVKGYGVYVEAFCKTRGENRTFRVDRINQEPSTYFQRPRRRYESDHSYDSELGTTSQKSSSAGSGCLLFVVTGAIFAALFVVYLFG